MEQAPKLQSSTQEDGTEDSPSGVHPCAETRDAGMLNLTGLEDDLKAQADLLRVRLQAALTSDPDSRADTLDAFLAPLHAHKRGLDASVVRLLHDLGRDRRMVRKLARAYAQLEGRLHSLRLLRSTPVSLHESTRSALDRWLELALNTARLATLETTHAGRELLQRAYRHAATADSEG